MLVYIGTSKYPSVLNEVYESLPEGQRMVTTYKEAVDAAILDLNTLTELKAKMSPEAWREFYECEWVRRNEFVFVVPKVNECVPTGVKSMGIDFNPVAGHAWVVVKDCSGIKVATDCGMATDLHDLYSRIVSIRPNEIHAESNGTNAGFFANLQEMLKETRMSLIKEEWNSRTKADCIENAKILCDEHRVLTMVDIPFENVEFDEEGKMVVKEHLVDAWLHALNENQVQLIMPKFRARARA